MQTVSDQQVQGWEESGVNQWSTGFLGSETSLYEPVMMDTRYYAFVEASELSITKMNFNVNNGLQLLVMQE